MSAESIFMMSNAIAMVGWLILIFLPFWHNSDQFITGIIVTLFAIFYGWIIFTHFQFSDIQKFGTLKGVLEIFTDAPIVVGGWIHYLAFDLMVGVFIKKNALKHGISHWLVIPCLLLTFMFGPLGLLLYFLIRFIVTRQYFAANY